MMIDEDKAINLLSQMFLIQFNEEEHQALGMAIDALNFKKWFKEQDLIRKDWVLFHRNCTHEECLKKNRDCNNCSYNVVEVKSILEIPKAEPPTEHCIGCTKPYDCYDCEVGKATICKKCNN